MKTANLESIAVGQALPVGIMGTAAELAKITGATVSGVLSLGSGPACAPVAGVLFDAPDPDGFVGLVPFPATLITAKGMINGTITVTKAGEVWSPDILTFRVAVISHV